MGADFVDEKTMNLKGWQFYLNSYTKRGKLNVSATIMTTTELLHSSLFV